MAFAALPDTIAIPSPEDVRATILDDRRLLAISAGLPVPDVSEGSDPWVDATVTANASALALAHVKRSELDRDVLTATGDKLDAIRQAEGLPELGAAPGYGTVTIKVSGTTSIPAGLQFLSPSGLRGAVDSTYASAVDGAAVAVTMLATGLASNLAAGTKIRWVNPPIGLLVEGTVVADFTGGRDAESDERKRLRIINRLEYQPAAGNWAALREAALNASTAIAECAVYPALGGPASVKVVCLGVPTTTGSRVVSNGILDTVRAAFATSLPDEVLSVVQSVADQPVNVALLASAATGHWVDAVPWPPMVSSTTPVVVSGSVSATVFGCTAAVAPTVGKTIAWWSPSTLTFQTAQLTAVSGISGAYVLTIAAPGFVGIAAGDYLSPAPVQTTVYSDTWKASLATLGAGENTTDPLRLPRSARHPRVDQGGAQTGLTVAQLSALIAAVTGLTDINYAYRSAVVPAVPGTVDIAPAVLVPRHFGIYAS